MATEENGVIQFTCEHCGISLTVDDSLAGVSGPCPSCGKPTKAPDQRLKESSGRGANDYRRRRESVRTSVDREIGRNRAPDYNRPKRRSKRVVSETQGEHEEVAAVTRLLLVGLIVLVVVLVAAYFGFQAFNS